MENERFNIHELRVCLVCIHLMANGEFDDGTDAAEKCAAGQVKEWGDNAKYLVSGSDCDEDCERDMHDDTHECTQFELGYSSSWCEGCGDTLHGDRFLAYCMIPKV